MRSYEGTVRVRIHAERGLMLDKGVSGSTLTAKDGDKILSLAIDAAKENGCGFYRWSFYIPGVNEKLSDEQETLTLAQVVKAKQGMKLTPRIKPDKYGKPRMTLADPEPKTLKASKYIDIA